MDIFCGYFIRASSARGKNEFPSQLSIEKLPGRTSRCFDHGLAGRPCFQLDRWGDTYSILLIKYQCAKPMMKVNVALYGSLARFGGGRYVAQVDVELKDGAGKADLLSQLCIPEKERGYLFINAMLCEVPFLSTGANE